MSEKIQIYQTPEFGNIRTMRDEKGEPLFCLKAVCEVLDLRTQKVVQRLEDDVLSKYPIVDSLGRTQQATFVNEDGLYDTILESRKPGAKAFRKWVTSEVLPSIRKQGGYMVLGADESDEVILARAPLPHLSYKLAVHLFRQELRQTRGLLDALKRVGYRKKTTPPHATASQRDRRLSGRIVRKQKSATPRSVGVLRICFDIFLQC